MSDLSIFIKAPAWRSLLEGISGILGVPGSDTPDETGNRHVWHVFGLDLIAIDNPKLDDDRGIPFSVFKSQVDLVLCDTDHLQEAEALRYALAVLIVLRLRDQLDPGATLVDNLQREIAVG